ncbi:MAG: hypothetical protein JWO77_2352 [Ilumatobacteraceae bacterium]|nr:hypothetical protein [Ilumatobacteraceae bacterium]
MIALVLIIGAIAGGAYVVSQREDAPPSAAAEDDGPKSGLQSALDKADEIEDALVPTTTTSPIGSSTTAPPEDITWAPVSDPASGLRWSMPGTDIVPVPDMVGLTMGGPVGESKTWGTFDYGLAIDVTVWDPAIQATQGDIDEIMQFDADYHKRINEPYGKALTIAGQPALAVLSTPEPDTTYVAMGVVDGTLVRVQVSAAGTPVDPAVFEQLLASFVKG